MLSLERMDTIEKVIYINLEHRSDRRQQVEEELKIFGDRVERFNAVQKSPGYIGCSFSHIGALQYAKRNAWKNVLIVEDDFLWTKTATGLSVFESLTKKPYDVILLGGTFITSDPNTYKLHSGQTALAYLVAEHYYDTLIANFKEGLSGLLRLNDYKTYALDQFWKRLQPHDNWFIVRPNLCMQRPSFSDIEQTFADYRCYYK